MVIKLAKVSAIALLVIAGNIAYVSVKTDTVPPPPHEIVKYGDHFSYLQLAMAPVGNDVRAPFCWRLLSPLIVHALVDPSDLPGMEVAFYSLNVICLSACLIVFFFFLESLGFSFSAGILGVFLLGSLPSFGRWYFYQYMMSDPAVLLVFALAFLFAQRRCFIALSVTLAVGVVGREASLLILAYLFCRLLREEGFFRACKVAGCVALLPVATLVFLHYSLVPDKSITHYSWLRIWQFLTSRLRDPNFLYFATVGTWGLVLVFLTIDARSHLRHLCRVRYEDGVFVAGVFAQLLVANNVDRLLVYAFPVFIPLALRTIQSFCEKTRWPMRTMIVIGCLQLYWYQSIVLWNDATRQPLNLIQVMLFFVLCAGLLLWSRHGGDVDPSDHQSNLV